MTLLPWSQLCRGAWAVRVFALLLSQVSSRLSLYSSSCFSTEPNIRRLYGRWSVRTQKTVMPVLVIGSENRFYTNNFYTNWSFGAGVQVAEWRVCICVCESDVTRERCFWRTFSFFFKSIYRSLILFPISSFCFTFVDCMCSFFLKIHHKFIYQCDAE